MWGESVTGEIPKEAVRGTGGLGRAAAQLRGSFHMTDAVPADTHTPRKEPSGGRQAGRGLSAGARRGQRLTPGRQRSTNKPRGERRAGSSEIWEQRRRRRPHGSGWKGWLWSREAGATAKGRQSGASGLGSWESWALRFLPQHTWRGESKKAESRPGSPVGEIFQGVALLAATAPGARSLFLVVTAVA